MTRLFTKALRKTEYLGVGSLAAAMVLAGCLSGTDPKDEGSHSGHDERRGSSADPGILDGPIQTPEASQPLQDGHTIALQEVSGEPQEPAFLNLAQALPKSAASTCNIDFNQRMSLIIIPDTARFTFATNPWYIQGCGDGWVHVMENGTARYGASWGSNYQHYHLGYTRGEFCLASSGRPGIKSGSSCLAVNPANEPRDVGSHAGSQWIRVYTYKSGTPEMTFSLKEIKVKNTAGITLWFRKSTGEWRHWSRIAPGWWNLSEASSIKEILIRGADGSAPYFLDDIVVSVP